MKLKKNSLESEFLIELVRTDFRELEKLEKHFNDINWDQLFCLAKNHRILPIVYKAISNIIPSDKMKLYTEQLIKYKLRYKRSCELLYEIQKIAALRKTRFVLFKGIPLSSLIYDDFSIRVCNDIDILVEECDVLKMDLILRNIGFVEKLSPDARYSLEYPITKHKVSNHVLPYYFYFSNSSYIKLELHTKIYSIPFNKIDRLIWEAKKQIINKCEFNIFNLVSSLLVLIANTYENSENPYSNLTGGKVIIRDYVDLYFFIKKYKKEIKNLDIKKILHEYNLESKTKIILENLECLYRGNETIDELCAVFDVCLEKQSHYDNSCFIKRLVSDIDSKKNFKKIYRNEIYDSYKNNFVTYTNGYINYNNKYGLNINYKIKASPKGYEFNLILPNELIGYYDYYLYQFELYPSENDIEYLYLTISLVYEDENWYAYVLEMNTVIFGTTDYKRGKRKLVKDVLVGKENISLLFNIESSYVLSNETNKDKVLFRFDLYKFVENNIFHLVNDKPTQIFSIEHFSQEK